MNEKLERLYDALRDALTLADEIAMERDVNANPEDAFTIVWFGLRDVMADLREVEA